MGDVEIDVDKVFFALLEVFNPLETNDLEKAWCIVDALRDSGVFTPEVYAEACDHFFGGFCLGAVLQNRLSQDALKQSAHEQV